jgi:PAS domain S-box-containing protein
MDPRLIVTTFPSRDGAFRRAVERVDVDAAGDAKEELTRRLKPLFPRVAVFDRGLVGEPAQLYVFRDGRFQVDADGRWWEADDVACVCLSASTGRLTYVSPQYAAIVGAAPDELVGHHYLEFVLPEAVDAAEAMFDALAHDREVLTEAVVRRIDGTPVRLQIRAARQDGEIDVRYRLLPGGNRR